MSGFSASTAQRLKVKDQPCVFCGQPGVDPAHVVPRSLGGCSSVDCVVPMCRDHHRAYDQGALDLLPALEPRYRAELAHAVTHLGLMGTVRRVTNDRRAA